MVVLPALVPELLVTDLDRSLAFWCGLVGFSVLYDRPEERFAMLTLGAAAVMLEGRRPGAREWVTGPLDAPFGRGLNLQIDVPALAPVLDRLAAARWPLAAVHGRRGGLVPGRGRGARPAPNPRPGPRRLPPAPGRAPGRTAGFLQTGRAARRVTRRPRP